MKNNKKYKRHRTFKLSVKVVFIVLILILSKYLIHFFKIEFLTINPLTSSAIGGAIFICSFLLAGIISDYKEAEKIPAEFRSVLESILDEVKTFSINHSNFNAEKGKQIIKNIIEKFFSGIHHENDHSNLYPCIEEIDKLTLVYQEM